MPSALAACAVWASLGLTQTFRLHFASLKNVQDSASSDVSVTATQDHISSVSTVLGQSKVDFEAFMTNDFRYNTRNASAWGWMKRTIFNGRRTFNDLKDELVTGHSCNGVGARSHTYYASSMCYWLPEITSSLKDHDQGSQGPGLKWVGEDPPGRQLCGQLTGAGRCLKCSVCHNNGRNPDGSVEATAFEEDVIDLPEDCLKETQIEDQCKVEFQGNHTPLVEETVECRGRETRYNNSVKALEENLQGQDDKEHLIEVTLPDDILNTQSQIGYLEGRLSANEETVTRERFRATTKCYPYRGDRWYRNLDSYMDVSEVLRYWPEFFCPPPWEPTCSVLDCPDEWTDYANKQREHDECIECRTARSDVQGAHDRAEQTRSELGVQRRLLDQLNQDLDQARRDLEALRAAEQGLRDDKEQAGTDWLPEKERCFGVYETYTNLLNQWMQEKIPLFYDVSCEKACLQSSLHDAGCAVMEGVMRGEIWEDGIKGPNPGIDVVCSPPSASFVLTPTKWGAEPETEFEMCQRIYNNDGQRPRRPQSIVKKDMLWKRERLWRRWRTRYFVLESGDAVRSAVMRYWTKPANDPDAEERGTKAIILWDAVSIVKEEGSKYRWTNGEECMRLKHFYREYILCSLENGAATRDEWFDLIGPEIRFPSQIK